MDGNIVLNFSEPVTADYGYINILVDDGYGGYLSESIDVTSYQVEGSGSSQITINPDYDLSYGTDYFINIDAGAFNNSS